MSQPVLWVDIETTGLNPDRCQIIEIAVVLTEQKDLYKQVLGPNFVIHCDRAKLETMADWCIKNHGKSGLTEESA